VGEGGGVGALTGAQLTWAKPPSLALMAMVADEIDVPKGPSARRLLQDQNGVLAVLGGLLHPPLGVSTLVE